MSNNIKNTSSNLVDKKSLLRKYIIEPLFYNNIPLTKNKFKNELFSNYNELNAILSKNAYLNEYKKINNKVTYNGIELNMVDKNNIISTILNEAKSFTMECDECVDYDIEVPKIEYDIICKKCKSKNLLIIQEHKRALDEASEYYLRCEDCKQKFYF